MQNEKIIKLKEIIDAILSDSTSKIEEAQVQIESAKKRLSDATETMAKAYEAADTKEYHKAQDKRREAQDAIAMFGDKLNDLTQKPLIDKDTFEKYASEIFAELNSMIASGRKELVTVTKTLQPMIDSIEDEIHDANALLELMQKKVLRDPHANDFYGLRQFGDYGLITCMRQFTNGFYFKESEKLLSKGE